MFKEVAFGRQEDRHLMPKHHNDTRKQYSNAKLASNNFYHHYGMTQSKGEFFMTVHREDDVT